MDALADPFLATARGKLCGEFWPRTCACLDALNDEQVWWRPNEESNSIGNLLLHLNGNVQQWIVAPLGKHAQQRDRDAEFAERTHVSIPLLRASLDTTIGSAGAILERLTPADLQQRHRIQDHDVTALEAIFHVVEHFAMHYGQILYITKMLQGRDLGFYAHLSKPKPR